MSDLTFLSTITDNPHMWIIFAFILLAGVMYAVEFISIEATSVLILGVVLLVFTLYPYPDFSPDTLLDGFSNPALVAVMALLVLGQAMVQTQALGGVISSISPLFQTKWRFAVLALLILLVIATSSVVNDTPTCVIFIPVFIALANQMHISPSHVMIPLSYATILGGTITLIGSSTNLLVAALAPGLGLEPIGMFDFTLPGVCIALVGWLYIGFVLPRTLPDRAPMAEDVLQGNERQFIVQFEITEHSTLCGRSAAMERLFDNEDVTLRMVYRRDNAYLAPFEDDMTLKAGDVLIASAVKSSLIRLVSGEHHQEFGRVTAFDEHTEGDQPRKDTQKLALVEVLVPPVSRLIGQSIAQIGFFHQYHCTVMGIQRRFRMLTSRLSELRLMAGDVMMLMGTRNDIADLHTSRDLMVIESSRHDISHGKNAMIANISLLSVVLVSATGMLPIHIAALLGALAVVAGGCLTRRQAFRALEWRVILVVAAGIAIATALEVTGGAQFLAKAIVDTTKGLDAVWIMSALFGLMALTTNILSNNATALIFTPIAVRTAQQLGAPVEMFLHAVIFASNCCSFASPIGFQTNLLVMGPGHYRFVDYIKAGVPLIFLVWITYTVFCIFYY